MFDRFFERAGQFFFQQMRPFFFFLFLATGPFLASFLLFQEKQALEIFEHQFSSIVSKSKRAFEKKGRKEKFLELHKKSDPYFLDKEIESLSFLEQEKKRLKNWLSHPAIANKEALWSRLRWLESDQNRLSFADDEMQFSKTVKETLEKQREIVELDQDDLKHLLALIEELPPVKMNRPQLVISEFSLTKKKTELQNEVFELKMELLKREFQ
ncbi:MAG TPA: hypothetical protein VHL30_00030 [Chlamydiales bacterium]|jgi:hypothetical protein|nr:hypothetical protein [Chlamydiales bacterium]